MSRFLVVDDETAARYGARRLLESAGHEVAEADSGEAALKLLETETVDAVLLDFQMGGMDGLAVLDVLQQKADPPPIVLFTAQGSEKIAVEAMRRGAHDYLVKPADADELVMTLERAVTFARTRSENERLREEVVSLQPSRDLLGDSAVMRKLKDDLRLMAPTASSVLLLGESGSGKEMVARYLHDLSGRKGPFVAVNCGALPATLIESELFGHEKGAFTGAIAPKAGKVRQAHGGTLFLDEIGDMPLEAQVRLLRVLEERMVEPLGAARPVPVEIRVIAATHRDLRQWSTEGKFREDLYYRLDVLHVSLPPLRERGSDVVVLARTFLRHYAGNRRLDFSPAAEKTLLSYRWPGNVRELRNVVERATVLCRGSEVGPELFNLPGAASVAASAPPILAPASGLEDQKDPETREIEVVGSSNFDNIVAEGWIGVPSVPADIPFRQAKSKVVDEFERRFILHHFERCGRNVSKAAQALDMHRQSLQQKLKDLGISRAGDDAE